MKNFLVALAAAWFSVALAHEPLKIKPLAEKKVVQLPAGELYWRIEAVESLSTAQRAAGDWGLAAESRGQAWLFTLGGKGGATGAGKKVAEVGPIPRPEASQYLLRINEASGTPGSVTPIHSHPGSEAFYVLSGEQSIRHPGGTLTLKPGDAEAGHGADVPMQVSSSGAADLHALVMFVVDANRAFSSPAKMP